MYRGKTGECTATLQPVGMQTLSLGGSGLRLGATQDDLAAYVGLEFDKLFGDLVVGSLGEYSQDGPARLVNVDALGEWQPTGARSLIDNVL